MALNIEARDGMEGTVRVVNFDKNQQALQTVDAIDWLGRPATKNQGGRKITYFLLATHGLWNVSLVSVTANLVLYLTRVLHQSNANAANNVTNLLGTIFLTTLLGGFMGDSYWGRLWTCIFFEIVHLLGMILLSLSVTMKSLKPPFCPHDTEGCSVSPGRVSFLFLSLYIIAVGSGGYLPALQTLGADQLDSETQKTNFFGWLLFFTNAGGILANTIFVYIENEGDWALGYWLSTATGGLAILVFALGVPTYRQYKPGGNPFVRFAQVLVSAFRKRNQQLPSNCHALYEKSDKEHIENGTRRISHTMSFRFLDKAAIETGSDDIHDNGRNPWRLCTVTQVEEMKCVCRMMPIWLCGVLFSVANAQIATLFVEQAATMDNRLHHFKIPPASISIFNVVSIFVWNVAYNAVVIPLARKLTGNSNGLTQLQRMTIGQVVSIGAMAVAAVVEMRRLQIAKEAGLLDAPPFAPVPMSIFWLVPQYCLLGLAQVFIVVGALDFFYTETSHSTRSLVGSLSLSSLAIGSYVSSLLVTVVMRVTKRGGSLGWIPTNLNRGHVDYFYWLLMGISIIDLVMFLFAARWYKYIPKQTDDSSIEQSNP